MPQNCDDFLRNDILFPIYQWWNSFRINAQVSALLQIKKWKNRICQPELQFSLLSQLLVKTTLASEIVEVSQHLRCVQRW